MTHPVNWPKKTFFYPIGNTPPVSFTHDLAPEENAEILLLACGDPRSILYTVHADLAPEFRNLDITCCDWEPAVLARNILLLTMIADDVSSVDAWPIFYHFFLDRKSYNILLAQCRTLIQSASDMEAWKSSKYGTYLRFCTEHSLAEIRRHWVLYLETGDLSDKDQKVLKKSFTSSMKSVLDNSVNILSALRSAGPVGILSIHEQGPKSFREFWTTGITSPTSTPKISPAYVNPTFVYSLSGKRFNVHYGTDPILAFHLASAMGDIKGAQSPSALSPKDLVASSMDQFASWWSSFKRRLSFGSKANIIIRFFVGETLAFCRALNVCEELKVTDTGVYSSPWSGMQIKFDPKEYGGTSPTAPLTFNIIDTSNLTDHAGLLNILIATVPLLRRQPWSVLYTNTLLVNTFEDGTSASSLSEKACGDIPTLSILLGIAPSSNLFHFTTHSNKHEVLASSIISSKSGLSQVHEPLAWRFPASIVANSTSLIHDSDVAQPLINCNANELAEFLFSVYLRMFASENMAQNMRDIGTANLLTSFNKQINVHYTRASLVGLLALIKARVQTEWFRVMDHFVDLVAGDQTLSMGPHAYQDLVCELYMRNLYSLDVLEAQYLERMRGPRDRFLGWKEVPSIVCIVLKVPRHYLNSLEEIDPDQIGTPMLQCESEDGSFHNIHTSIQLVFGELEVSNIAGERSAIIMENPQGWEGKSPLIATFYLPSWILTVTPKETRIGLHVRNTPQSLMSLMDKLGMRLTIYSTSLSDTEHVEVLRHRPDNIGEVDHTRHLSSVALSQADGADDGKVTMKFDSSGHKATTLTIRDNIRAGEAAKSLADKAEVTIKPLADCTILASYAQHQRYFIFPFPVHGAAAKLRIARKSLYLEVEAPIRPHFEDFLDLSLNPFSIYHDSTEHINLLNIHYLNLDVIPALKIPSAKKKLEWLSIHMRMTLSETEKKARDRSNQADRGTMVNLKESIATIFIKYCGLDDPQQARMPYGLCNPVEGMGMYTLIFVNDIRLDVASHTVVVDACVVPLIKKIMPNVSPVLAKLSDRGLIQIVTLDDETRAWRLLLPAFAERCRKWKHLDTCEYLAKGIPAEVDGLTVSPLCSCGKGKNLGSFGNMPDWKLLRSEATRVAIGPLFTFSFMEGMMAKMREATDEKSGKTSGIEPQSGGSASSSSKSPQCARCGGPGKPTLQACSVCKNTKYCSKDCQKNDWKSHKSQCIRAS